MRAFPIAERIELAKKKIDKMMDQIINLAAIHENNAGSPEGDCLSRVRSQTGAELRSDRLKAGHFLHQCADALRR